jgi:hypothetical protein
MANEVGAVKSAQEYADLWSWIARVERGEVTLTPKGEVEWGGDTAYEGSDGSSCVVFMDCGEWDYFDTVVLANGSRWEYDQLVSYRPDPDIAVQRYGVAR